MPFWAVRARGEAMRHPRIHGHIGEHARPVNETCLSGDNQQRAFREKRQKDKGLAEGKLGGDTLGQHRVHGLA